METAVMALRRWAPSIAAAFLAFGCFEFDLPEKVETGSLSCDGGRHDPATGLCWQYPATGGQFDWQGAKDQCDGLDLAGHDDWRLPSLDDLLGLFDDCDVDLEGMESSWCVSCSGSEVCNALFSEGPQWGLAWSATPCDFFESCAWSVDFGSGGVNATDTMGGWLNAPCVRTEGDTLE